MAPSAPLGLLGPRLPRPHFQDLERAKSWVSSVELGKLECLGLDARRARGEGKKGGAAVWKKYADFGVPG
eukprot:4226822-Alexandrium_andersonii.AAC.1